jgi:site-specific recombinase XerD
MAKQPKSKARARAAHSRAPQKLLTPDEVERLRSWAYTTLRSVQDRRAALAVTLLGTGGRRFEVAALRCEHIRMGSGGPEVYFPEIKGGGGVTVPISDETFRILTRWTEGKQDRSPLIPTEQGEFMSSTTVWNEFKAALVAAGITRKGIGVHAARHAAGFLLLRATGDLTKVQVFLHHKSLATTASWYAHVHAPDLRAGLKKAGI